MLPASDLIQYAALLLLWLVIACASILSIIGAVVQDITHYYFQCKAEYKKGTTTTTTTTTDQDFIR